MAPKKIRCDTKECRVVVNPLIARCDFCLKNHCSKHRLLEDHKCTGLEDCKQESHARNAAQLESERTQVIRGV